MQNNFLRQMTILSSKSTWNHYLQHYTNIEPDKNEWGPSALLQKHNYTTSFFLDFWFWNFSEKIVKNIFQEFFPGLFGEETFRYRAFLMLWHQLKNEQVNWRNKFFGFF